MSCHGLAAIKKNISQEQEFKAIAAKLGKIPQTIC
jgi:hypothetical protein